MITITAIAAVLFFGAISTTTDSANADRDVKAKLYDSESGQPGGALCPKSTDICNSEFKTNKLARENCELGGHKCKQVNLNK